MRSLLKLLAALAAVLLFVPTVAQAQFGIPGIPRVPGVPRIPGIPGGGRIGSALNALDRLGVVDVPRIGYSPLGNHYAPGYSSIYTGRGYGSSYLPYYYNRYGYGYDNGYRYNNGYSQDGVRLSYDDPNYWNSSRTAGGGSSQSGRDFDGGPTMNRWMEPLDTDSPRPLVAMGGETPYEAPVRPVVQPAYANPFTPYNTRPTTTLRTLWWPFFDYDPAIAYYGASVEDAEYQVALLDTPGLVATPFRPNARSEPQPVSAEDRESAQKFTRQGEQEFRSGSYERATRSFRHAVLDDPRNGVVMLMLAQGLMATGSYEEAAGATQQAMLLLPEEQWGVVVANYRDLYGPRVGDYNEHLKALKEASDQQGDNPALHFLLAYQYGYLKYPDFAVKRLAKVAKLAPDDRLSTRLREIMRDKQKTNEVLPPE